MKTVLLTIAMFTVCGLVVAASGGEPARSAAPAAQLAPAATAPLPAGPLELAPATPASTSGDAGCTAATASEDAVDCAAGGWSRDLNDGCCLLASAHLNQQRWTKGTQTKCCGACVL
jgi:hypothetical protein